jgi:diguanylate cyclase (GGDEF)-like protein/PAS domain S-box-containing protein
MVTFRAMIAETQGESSPHVIETLLREVVNSISDVFLLRDASDSRMLYVSRMYEEIWGRSCASLYENPGSLFEAVHPDDRAAVSRARETGRLSGSFELQHRIVRPDGSIRWIEARSFPIRDAAGELVRIAILAKDITKFKETEQEFRESQRRFTDMLCNMDLAALMLDCEANITFCNDYFLRLTGWRNEEVIGRNYHSIFFPTDQTLATDYFANLLAAAPDKWNRETELFTKTGERLLVSWSNLALRTGSGEIIGCASIGEDVTERKRGEARIVYLNRVHSMLSGINALIVRVSELDVLFNSACRIAVAAGGFTLALMGVVDRVSKTVKAAAVDGDDDTLVAAVRRVLVSAGGVPSQMVEQVIREKRAVISNDSQNDPTVAFRDMHVQYGCRSMAIMPLIVAEEVVGVFALYSRDAQAFHDEELALLMQLSADIAFAIDHIQAMQRLDHLAYYDGLTGLANRSLFLDRLTHHLRAAGVAGHRVAVLMMDIERFKNVNSSLGQGGGDTLLNQVAEWLIRTVGDASLLTRVGGDRFAIIMTHITLEHQAALFVEDALKAIRANPFVVDGTELRISARAGVAIFPEDGDTADLLLKNAEAALKKAKVGRDPYLFFADKMTQTVSGRLTLENQLLQALHREEFALYYQPKISISSREIIGAEALIRWNHPKDGLILPDHFIPMLEETGMIDEVGRWALRRAIADYLRWLDGGLKAVRLGVNVSPLQLRNSAFASQVREAISIDPRATGGIEMEITESVIIDDMKKGIANLHAIRAMGIGITVDDFGIGFSSLSYLAKLPVDTIKIDRSFVTDMTSGPEGLALVSMIISLARTLKLKVVAEGVETEEQAHLLRLLNCDQMQGYLFSRPLRVDIFEAKYLSMQTVAAQGA